MLGQPTYLALKDKGESSMSVKQLNAKVCNVKRCESCSHGETWIGLTLVPSGAGGCPSYHTCK
jgi:hypothetical protein